MLLYYKRFVNRVRTVYQTRRFTKYLHLDTNGPALVYLGDKNLFNNSWTGGRESQKVDRRDPVGVSGR